MIPLLSVRALSEFTPQEYYNYVQTLYIEPETAAPPADFTVKLNAKGNPVIRINRKPKFLTGTEVLGIAKELDWTYQKLWLHLLKKKIELRRPIRVK